MKLLILALLLSSPIDDRRGGSSWDPTADYTTTGSMSVKELNITPACTIAADDTTPSVAGCSVLVTSANTGATVITDLDLPTVGQIVTICGGSATNSSTIADSGNFNLDVTFGGFTAYTDNCLTLYVQADNDYVEVSRSYNYTTVSAINGGRITATGGVKANGTTAATGVLLGDGAPGAIGYISAQTPDSTVMAPTATSNSWLVCEYADVAYDFAHALQTNPTVFIHSANQSTTEWVSIAHNQTDAVIASGAGDISLTPAGGFNVAPKALASDAAAAPNVISSQNPYQSPTTVASTNRNGANIVLAPGQGKQVVGEIVPATVAGKTITLTVTAQGAVAAGVTKTEGVASPDGFACATLTAAECATNILTLLNGAGAVTGCTATCIDETCSNGQIAIGATVGVAERCVFTTNGATAFPLTAGDQGSDGKIIIPVGGTATPTIVSSGWPTSGISSSASAPFHFSASGTEVLRMNSSGVSFGAALVAGFYDRGYVSSSVAGQLRATNGSQNGAGIWVNYPQTITCADSTDGNPSDCGGAQTISSNVVIVNCADASGGCTLTLAETNYSATVAGNVIFHAGATQTTQLTLADAAGVVELAGGVSWTPAAIDTLCLSYSPALYWAECGRSDNTP